jgi:hypothetical protein
MPSEGNEPGKHRDGDVSSIAYGGRRNRSNDHIAGNSTRVARGEG